MIACTLKLKLSKQQEETLNSWLPILQSVYNFAIRKIELNAKNNIYYGKNKFNNLLANHSYKLGVPSHTLSSILMQAYTSWNRYFKKIDKKPKLKSHRNKLNSIPFPDPINLPQNGCIKIPLLGYIKFFKQNIPNGRIKGGRILKRASGWCLVLNIDAKPNIFQSIKLSTKQTGIDTGLRDLLTLSDGTKFPNPEEFSKLEKRLGQAQRGNNKQLAARVYERIKNQRRDRNHKISRKVTENYQDIFITKDNLVGMKRNHFGKTINNANIGQLRNFILYKGSTCGRRVEFVSSINTTKRCSNCWSLTGPSGLHNLNVRSWKCSACGADHDRDINSAMVILKTGLGLSLGDRNVEKQNQSSP